MRASRRSHRPPSRVRRSVPLRARGAGVLLHCCLPVLLAVAGCAGRALEEWTLDAEEQLTIGAEPVTLETAFYRPLDLGFDHQGNVFVLDSGNHRVQVFDSAGRYLRSVGEQGVGPGQLTDAQGMFVHPDGRVWIADTRGRRIQPYAADGRALEPLMLELPPLDLVVGPDRMFVQRLPQASMLYGPDPAPLISVLDHHGNITGGFVDATPSQIGVLYMLENMLAMAPGPGGGIAVTNTHFDSLLRVYRAGGQLEREVPVLYKAGAWAPLGRRPTEVNDASVARIARTSLDLAWDERRRLFWALAGYVDQTPEGEWILGREVYRYDPDGEYRGSVMLRQRTVALGLAPDGRLWTIDAEGVVHAFQVTDPDLAPAGSP